MAEILARHGLPTSLDPDVATSAILETIARDKKAGDDALNMVLIGAPGDVRLRVTPSWDAIAAAVQELRG